MTRLADMPLEEQNKLIDDLSRTVDDRLPRDARFVLIVRDGNDHLMVVGTLPDDEADALCRRVAQNIKPKASQVSPKRPRPDPKQARKAARRKA